MAGSDSRSVLGRSAPPPDFTLTYGEHPDHVIDVRVGARNAVSPLLIFLHGGFWRDAYDRAHTAPLAAALAALGITVATPEYRRTGAPGGGWPGTFDDVTAALTMVAAAVAAHTPVGPVGLAGHSAGGHLALWAAARTAGVRGVVALAPVADLARADELDLGGGAVRALLGGGPAEQAERYAVATPAVPVGVPVTLIHGDADRQVPREFSESFARRATTAGDDVKLVMLPNADHFAVIDPLSQAWPIVVSSIQATLGVGPEFDDGQDSR